tara:strand:- start:25 stop:552 length:528 start_codon:yes stop_codon:yes gene_type:complete
MAFKMKGSSFYGSTPFKQVKTKNFGPRAAKGDDDQSKELARSKYEMGEYKNDPTGQADTNDFDDKALDRKQDAEGKGKGSNRKVMKDGAVNKTQATKIANNKADFAKKTAAEKKALQDKANAKRKAFEASPEYKKRRAAADKKTSQENFEPAYEGADYSKKDIAKMNSKQKKDIE